MLRVNKMIHDIRALEDVVNQHYEGLTYIGDGVIDDYDIAVNPVGSVKHPGPLLEFGEHRFDIDHIPALISWLQSLIEEVPE